MPLKTTEKCGSTSLDVFRSNGWTDELLVAHGYAVDEADAATPLAVPPVVVTSSDGKKHVLTMPAPMPNAFGVTDLAEIHAFYNEKSLIKFYPNGYSFQQQILYAAELLARSRGLIK